MTNHNPPTLALIAEGLAAITRLTNAGTITDGQVGMTVHTYSGDRSLGLRVEEDVVTGEAERERIARAVAAEALPGAEVRVRTYPTGFRFAVASQARPDALVSVYAVLRHAPEGGAS